MHLLWMAIYKKKKHLTLRKELPIHPKGRMNKTSKEHVSSSRSILLREVCDVITSQ
jgi:hypothetical protein